MKDDHIAYLLYACLLGKNSLLARKQCIVVGQNHRRPNLRMNDQVLRVFNGFYKQIYSQPKLF
jgi:hypothetical protein